jgi:hypothetical protein
MKPTLAAQNKQLALSALDTLFNRPDYDAAGTMWSDRAFTSARAAPGYRCEDFWRPKPGEQDVGAPNGSGRGRRGNCRHRLGREEFAALAAKRSSHGDLTR